MESTPTSVSGSISSEMLCSICLGTMKPGHGQALFTAECSHVFHFHCIASNVKHGNQVCPVCRSKWKAIPFQDPAADVVSVRSRISPSDSPQDGRWMAFFRRLTSRGRHSDSGRRYNPVFQDTGHRSNPVFQDSGRQSNPALQDSGRRSNPVFHATDSNAYNDDEHLDTSLSEIPASESKEGLTKTVEMESFVGLTAVSASDCRDSFSVLIHLKAPSVGQKNGDRAPVDLVTVLDVSGSMEGTKISLLKRAMGFVIQNLGPFDRLSVVSFSSTARRLFHLRRMTDSGHERALRAVNSLVAGGTTNIVEGLSKGAKVLEDRREKNPVCSIILLSDGQDNHNVRRQSRRSQNFDYQAFLPLSHIRGDSQQWQTQMPVHTFGFGADHEASLMHSISEASGGTFSFIEAESMIQDAFAQCIGGLLSVVVQDLQVRLECVSPGVSINSIHAGSYAGRVFDQGQKGLVEAGDLYAEEERDFIVEVRIPASSMTSDPLHGEILVILKVGCVYKDPVLQKPINVDAKQVVIQRPESVSSEENIVCIEVDRQKNRLKAAEAMAEASALAEQDNLAGAVALLGNQRKALSQSVAAKAGDGLCMALDAELKEMQERMASRQVYEASGRSYIFSGLSAHSQQRATTRGVSTDGTSTGYGYHTPLMVDMLKHSQTWSTSSHDHPRP